jgi:hypothetical protein
MAQFPANIDLSSLDGSNGFTLNGVSSIDDSGWPVASAGDVNGDGFADLIVGAPSAYKRKGASYIVFGRAPDTAVNRIGTVASQTLAGGVFDDTLSGRGGRRQDRARERRVHPGRRRRTAGGRCFLHRLRRP